MDLSEWYSHNQLYRDLNDKGFYFCIVSSQRKRAEDIQGSEHWVMPRRQFTFCLSRQNYSRYKHVHAESHSVLVSAHCLERTWELPLLWLSQDTYTVSGAAFLQPGFQAISWLVSVPSGRSCFPPRCTGTIAGSIYTAGQLLSPFGLTKEHLADCYYSNGSSLMPKLHTHFISDAGRWNT